MNRNSRVFTVKHPCTYSSDQPGQHSHSPRITAQRGSLQRIDPTLDLLHQVPITAGWAEAAWSFCSEALPNSSHMTVQSFASTSRRIPLYALHNVPGTFDACWQYVEWRHLFVEFSTLSVGCWREANPGRQHRSRELYPYSTELHSLLIYMIKRFELYKEIGMSNACNKCL